MDNPSESDTSFRNKGIDGLFHSWLLFDAFFMELFIKAKQHRRSYYEDEKTTAFRLF